MQIMNNTTIDILMKRKSVRVFKDQEIEEEKVEAILKASINAPTAGNQQLYTILKITDPAIKEQLSILCDNQPFIASAKLILVYLADCHKWYEAYKDIESVIQVLLDYQCIELIAKLKPLLTYKC